MKHKTYIVNNNILIHLQEDAKDEKINYFAFDLIAKSSVDKGSVLVQDVKLMPNRILAAAYKACCEMGFEAASLKMVSSAMLDMFPEGRLLNWKLNVIGEADKRAVRIIDSNYQPQFCLLDGSAIRINKGNGSVMFATVKFIDEFHFYVGAIPWHCCQFAEYLDRNDFKCSPEEIESGQAAWTFGEYNDTFLLLQSREKNEKEYYNYIFFQQKEVSVSGNIGVTEKTLNEIRNDFICRHKLSDKTFYQGNYEIIKKLLKRM